MLLTIKDMTFLSTVLERDESGGSIAKHGLTAEQRERLRELDEANVMSYGDHLVENYNEIENCANRGRLNTKST